MHEGDDDFGTACMLYAQLPKDRASRKRVVRYLNRIDDFRDSEETLSQEHHEVVLLRRKGVGGASGNSPSFCPSRSDRPSVRPK